jgi:hypothetical protein
LFGWVFRPQAWVLTLQGSGATGRGVFRVALGQRIRSSQSGSYPCPFVISPRVPTVRGSLYLEPLSVSRFLCMLWATVPWRPLPRLVWVSSIILNCPTHLWVPIITYPRRLLFWWLGRRGCDRWCTRDSAGHLGESRTTERSPMRLLSAGASATPVARVWATWLGFGSDIQSVRGSTGPVAWELHALVRISVTGLRHVRGF